MENSSRKTIDKAMRVLMAFSAEQPELTVTEVSERLGLHKSIISRMASALRSWGMLEKDPQSQKLRIGEAAFRIGSLFSQGGNLVAMALPHMEELVLRTQQTCHLTVLDGHRFLVVASVESPSALRVIMRQGERRPLHSTAGGKLFLSESEGLLNAVLAEPLEALTPRTLNTAAKLRKAVAQLRTAGIAWNEGESNIGAGAVAAPVRDAAGPLIAVLSTVYPLHVVEGRAREQVGQATLAAAQHIFRDLMNERRK